jgi:hypothetical protein
MNTTRFFDEYETPGLAPEGFPILSTYCSDLDCAPSYPCATCELTAVGRRASYRRPGGKPATFTGLIVEYDCAGCGSDVVHVLTDAGDIHHVPVACLVRS